MTNTKSDVINSAKRVFPSMGNTAAVDYFDYTDREVRSQVHFNSDSESFTAIVNGTRLYNFATNVMGAWEARWQNSATTNDFTALTETSVEAEAQDDPEYLKRAGTPTRFAVDGGQLWLHPAPNVNSTNGYPRVVVRVDRATSMNNADTMPADVPTHDVWKYGILKRYASDIGDPKAQGFEIAFERALARLQAHRHGKSRYVSPKVKPKAFFNSPKVR